MAIKRLCISSGCNCFAEPGHKYCTVHLKQSQEKHQKWLEEHKEKKPFSNSANPNGDFYNSYKWRMLRKEHLKIEPQCAICGNEEELTVDHIIPPKGNEEMFFDKYNLQTLCWNCHRKKTAFEVKNKE